MSQEGTFKMTVRKHKDPQVNRLREDGYEVRFRGVQVDIHDDKGSLRASIIRPRGADLSETDMSKLRTHMKRSQNIVGIIQKGAIGGVTLKGSERRTIRSPERLWFTQTQRGLQVTVNDDRYAVKDTEITGLPAPSAIDATMTLQIGV